MAATAAAIEFDRAEVARFLGQARGAADRLGSDRNDQWTAFGPTNVRIHEVSTAVAFGDAKLAVETGELLDSSALPAGLLGRLCQIRLDLASAYAQQRHDAAAVNQLLDAERIAPELVRYDDRTRVGRSPVAARASTEHAGVAAVGSPSWGDLADHFELGQAFSAPNHINCET